jgi:hypothetical protein
MAQETTTTINSVSTAVVSVCKMVASVLGIIILAYGVKAGRTINNDTIPLIGQAVRGVADTTKETGKVVKGLDVVVKDLGPRLNNITDGATKAVGNVASITEALNVDTEASIIELSKRANKATESVEQVVVPFAERIGAGESVLRAVVSGNSEQNTVVEQHSWFYRWTLGWFLS